MWRRDDSLIFGKYVVCYLGLWVHIYTHIHPAFFNLEYFHIKEYQCWTSLVVQKLRFHASNVGGMGLILGQGSSIFHVVQSKKKRISVFLKVLELNKSFKSILICLSNI